MDEAFHFYYQDAFDALREAGCEVIFFSPIHDRTVPEGLDGLYLGGGYPETMARELSGNESMRESVRAFAESGKALYAECGGLMYLSQSVITLQGDAYPMAGILPVNTRMCARRRALRYAEVRLTRDALWGRAGDLCRGHEFHYSELVEDWPWDSRWERVYALKHRKDEEIAYEGFQRGRVLSSYVHLHLAGRPEAVSRFVSGLKE